MTATKPSGPTGWETFKDWAGFEPAKKKGGGKKGKKGKDAGLEDLAVLGVGLLIAVAVFNWLVITVVAWWYRSFLPWWETWHLAFYAAAVIAGAGTVFTGVLWARSAWLRRMQARAEKRQPARPGKEKPTVRVEADDMTRTATKVIVTHDHADHPTPPDVARLADIHGVDHWGAPAKSEVAVNKKTGRTQVILTPPDPEPVRDSVERDLTTIAQEQLPHVQAVTVTARDLATGLPTRVEVHHEVTAKLLASPAIGEAIERALAAQLGWTDPNTYRMHWDRERSVGILEQCDDPLPRVVPFPFGKITDIIDRDSKRLCYGVAADGSLVYWDLDCAPHSLIAGKTGSGKTVALTTFVVMALLMGWQVVMIDPKKLAFRELDGLPNFERYGDAKGLESAREMADAIDTMHDVMEARYDLPKKELKQQQRILFLIDETFICVDALNDLWAAEKEPSDRTTEHPSVGKLRRMSGLAREALMHMMLAIQRPDVAIMGKGAGYMRSNLDNKISIGPMDADGAPMMFGRGTKWARLAQTLPTVKGRALGSLPDGATGYQLAQVWFVDVEDDDIVKQVEAMVVDMYGRHERLVGPLATEPGEQPVVEEMSPSRPAKKAATNLPAGRPAKKTPARRPKTAAKVPLTKDDDEDPVFTGRDSVHPGQLKRGDWTVIVVGGERQKKRIAVDPKVSEDGDTVTLAGFGWERTFDATDTVPLLNVEG